MGHLAYVRSDSRRNDPGDILREAGWDLCQLRSPTGTWRRRHAPEYYIIEGMGEFYVSEDSAELDMVYDLKVNEAGEGLVQLPVPRYITAQLHDMINEYLYSGSQSRATQSHLQGSLDQGGLV